MSKNFSNSNNEKINNQKSRNRLVKSSSTGVNNLYEKYIDKIYLNKNNTRNKENDLRKYNSSASKVNNNKKNTSNSSFNSFNQDGEKIMKNNVHLHSFSKIMEKYFQQKNKEINHNKKYNNINRNCESNRSNIYFSNNKKGNIINQNLNKNKNESINIISHNKNKSSRNKNLSMREIDSTSYVKSLKHTHNNFRKENIYPKKIYQLDSNIIIKKANQETSPSNKKNKSVYKNLFNNENKKSRNKNKSNSLKKTDSNCSEIEIEKKYNLIFSSDSKINNLNKLTFPSLKNGDSDITKPNTLNTKIDELEGPEIIHFSLIDLIQRGKKRMEEISNNLDKEK